MSTDHAHPVDPRVVAVARERTLSAPAAARLTDTLAAVADGLVVRIVAALGSGGGLSSDELAAVLGVAGDEIASVLAKLEDRCVVRRCAQGPSTDCWHSEMPYGAMMAALLPVETRQPRSG